MDDDQLLRYSRQIMLPQIGIQGQERLQKFPLFVRHVTGISRSFVQDSWYLPFGWIGLFVATILPNGNFQMASKSEESVRQN